MTRFNLHTHIRNLRSLNNDAWWDEKLALLAEEQQDAVRRNIDEWRLNRRKNKSKARKSLNKAINLLSRILREDETLRLRLREEIYPTDEV